ncbi:Gfo/Idh/MocA family protein [Jiangella asiatica]|nr:Gfo/Idh/MocA family oxidoreductase [Jiangella asiatica]
MTSDSGAELRIGIIGTDNTHAYPFTAFLNGWALDAPIPAVLPDGTPVADMYLWGTYLRQQTEAGATDVPISGARVTSLWSADPREAALLGRACGIENLCETAESVCAAVDAVMVLSERPETHAAYAAMALERGLPTFVDKPLADSLDAGREIFELAERHGVPCYTGSALRWAPDLIAAREYVRTRLGAVRAVHVPCPLELELYGIHAVEMVNLFMGCDVATVRAIGGTERQVVLLEYADGRTAVFEHLGFVTWPAYSACVYGDRWEHRVVLDGVGPAMAATVRAFVEVARGATVPVCPPESLRLNEIVFAARESLRSGKVVSLA